MPVIQFPEDLPISARREDILSALRAHQVLVIAGETGSGKTTQLPKLCLAAGLAERGRIGCTQPRRVAALSVSRRVAEELGVAIEGPHQDDIYWISRLQEDGSKYGITGRPFTPARWLVDGDRVTVGELTLDVCHCPGHTPGHVVFHHPGSKLAIVGDVLFQGSVGRWDFPHGNQEQLIRSITEKLWPMGDATAFVPGHGPMSTFGHERKTNPFVSDAALAA
jgi:hypothetical protein